MKIFIKQTVKEFTRFSLKATYVFILFIVLVAISTYTAVNIIDNNDTKATRTIGVQGKATKKVTPDEINISFGGNYTDKDILALQNKAHKAVNKATEEIKALGIEEKDISTNNYNIAPEYDYSTNSIKNYRIQIRMQVTIHDLDKNEDLASKVLEKAISAGLNEVYYLQYNISNRDEIMEQLKDEAIQNAKENKKHQEEVLGVKLGKLVRTSLDDNIYYYDSFEPVQRDVAISEGEESRPNVENINLNPGQEELEYQVTLYYEIK